MAFPIVNIYRFSDNADVCATRSRMQGMSSGRNFPERSGIVSFAGRAPALFLSFLATRAQMPWRSRGGHEIARVQRSS